MAGPHPKTRGDKARTNGARRQPEPYAHPGERRQLLLRRARPPRGLDVAGEVALVRGVDQQLLDDRALRQRRGEQHGGGDVLGEEHRGALLRRRRLRPVVQDRGVDLAGQDRGGPDALVPVGGVQVVHEVHDARLRGAVGRAAEQAGPHGRDRRHGDHGACAAVEHVRQHRPGQGEHAAQVDPHHVVPVVIGQPAGVARLRRDPCHVDQHVHRTDAFVHAIDERGHLRRVVDRGGLDVRGAARLADRRRDLLEQPAAAPHEDGHRALGGQRDRGGRPDSAAGPGDQADLVLQRAQSFLHLASPTWPFEQITAR
jgi:hypothetical protein